MAQTGEIHDLGYTRYDGARTPQRRRFWVIARNVFSVGWRRRWGVQMPIFLSIAITLIGAFAIYFILQQRAAAELQGRRLPAIFPDAEDIIFRVLGFYQLPAVILTTVVACPALANDLRLGAFSFYFARALRPRDYIGGKLLGLTIVLGIPMFAGPVVVALSRVFYAESLARAFSLLHLVPRAMALGVAGTAAFVFPAVGLGALVHRRIAAQAIYLIYFTFVSAVAMGMSEALELPGVRLVATFNNVSIIGRALFGLDKDPEDPAVWAAIVTTIALSGAGLALVIRRVRGAEAAGVGG